MYVGSLGPAARCGKPCVWPQYGDAGGEVRELVRCGDVRRACALTVSVSLLCPIRLQGRSPSVPSVLSFRLSVRSRRSSPPSAHRHAPSRAPPLSELEFRCKNLFLIWEKHWEARIRWSHFSYYVTPHLYYMAVPM